MFAWLFDLIRRTGIFDLLGRFGRSEYAVAGSIVLAIAGGFLFVSGQAAGESGSYVLKNILMTAGVLCGVVIVLSVLCAFAVDP